MPRDNSGLFYYPPGTEAVPLEPAQSGDVNARFDAVRDDLNGTVPVTRGGTGGASASAARTALSVYSKTETNSVVADQFEDAFDAEIGGAFTNTALNGTLSIDRIGSLIFAVNNTGATVSYGTPVAGSKINPTGVTAAGGLTPIAGAPRTGQWISLGQAFHGHATLFVKRSM